MKVRGIVLAVVLLGALASTASAAPIFGEAWHVVGDNSSLARLDNIPNLGSIPTTGADVTFWANGFHFNLGDNDTNSLAAFLASGGAFDITGAQGILGADISDTASSTVYATFFKFTGQLYLQQNQIYHVTHDDGFYLDLTGPVSVNGVTHADGIVDYRTPVRTATSEFTFLGATGAYDFVMYYGEWNGLPANLDSRDLSPVPEPTSMLLLGTGLVGLGRAWRKRRS